MKRAFVTGASGLLGRSLLPILQERGFAVRALYRQEAQAAAARAAGFEAVLGDIRDVPALRPHLEGMTHVFHLAAALSGGARVYEPVNHRAVPALARAALEAAPDLVRFVFVSSRGAVGPSRDGNALTEASREQPVYDYGWAKLRAERALVRIPGLPWCAVRPPLLYGPGDGNTLVLFRLAARGLFFRFSGGYRIQSLLHVKDAARATALAGTAPGIEGRKILLAGPARVTPDLLRDGLARAAGRRLREIRIPVALLLAAAEALSPLRGRNFLFELGYERGDADPEEAREALDFAAGVSLTDGLRETMQWYRRAGLVAGRESPRPR